MDDSLDAVDARLRSLGVLRYSPSLEAELDALVLRLEDPAVRSAAARDLPRYRRISRWHRLLVGGVIVIAGVGVAVPATALATWLARTGEFGDPSTSSEVDDTEWIDLGAADAPQVVIDAYPPYLTLPDTVPREAAIADVSRIFDKLSVDAGGQAVAQEGLMTQTYETFALCAWTGEWLSSHKVSDAGRAAAAADWLGDTSRYPSLGAHDGGGVVESILSFASAARSGNVDEVEDAFEMQGCDTRLSGAEK